MQATNTHDIEVQVIQQGHISRHPLSTIKAGFIPKRQALTLTRDQELDLCKGETPPTPTKVLEFASPELALTHMGDAAGYGLVAIGHIPAGTALLYTGSGINEIITLDALKTRNTDQNYGIGWRPNFPGKFFVYINAEKEGDLGGFIQHTPSEEECKNNYVLTPSAEAARAHANLELGLVNVSGDIYLALTLTEECHGTPDKPIMLGYSYGPEYWSQSIPQLLSKSGVPLGRSTYTYIPPNKFYFSNSSRTEDTSSAPAQIRNLYGYALGNYSRLIDPGLTLIHEKINNLFASAGFIPSPFGCLFFNNIFIITHRQEAIVEVKIKETPREFADCYLPITEPDFNFKWRRPDGWRAAHESDLQKVQRFLAQAQKIFKSSLTEAAWEGAPHKTELNKHIEQLTEYLYKFVISKLFEFGRVFDTRLLLIEYETAVKEARGHHYTGPFHSKGGSAGTFAASSVSPER